jgi:hypothetical protein
MWRYKLATLPLGTFMAFTLAWRTWLVWRKRDGENSG